MRKVSIAGGESLRTDVLSFAGLLIKLPSGCEPIELSYFLGLTDSRLNVGTTTTLAINIHANLVRQPMILRLVCSAFTHSSSLVPMVQFILHTMLSRYVLRSLSI